MAEDKNTELQPDFKNTEWYQHLVEDCKATVVETGFSAKMALVEGYHKLGERISQENDNFERAQIYGAKAVKSICEGMGKSPAFVRVIYYAIQFYKKYPDLDEYMKDKNKINFGWTQVKAELSAPTKEDIPEKNLKPEEKGEDPQVKEKQEKPHIEWAFINGKYQIMMTKDVIASIDWSKVKTDLLLFLEGSE